MSRIIVLSLGGTLVSPRAGEIDLKYLRDFRDFVLRWIKKDTRFVIVVGGGKIARTWRDAAKSLGVKKQSELDWVGIKATHLNAELVRTVFGRLAYLKIITDPPKKINFKQKILVAGGWQPGCSTDYDAVLLGIKVGAKEILNLSDIDFIYDKNPKQFPAAKPQEKLTWQNYLKIISRKWLPGGNYPFDPVASLSAQKAKLKVAVLNGKNFKNLENFLAGKKFKGTVIKN